MHVLRGKDGAKVVIFRYGEVYVQREGQLILALDGHHKLTCQVGHGHTNTICS
jgi:hypothetical protein